MILQAVAKIAHENRFSIPRPTRRPMRP